METFAFRKWVVWTAIGFLFPLLSLNVISQPGFLSISCGAIANFTDENNIKWVTDDNYIDVGKKEYTGDTSQALQYLRHFPQPLNKSCYQLPVIPSVPYLLRLWFGIGHYIGFAAVPNFAFSIETRDMLAVRNVSVSPSDNPRYAEKILDTAGRVLSVCLIRISDTDDPFINAIELRTLPNGMYPQAKPGTMLRLLERVDIGGNSSVRYPQDKLDRIWESDTIFAKKGSLRFLRIVSLPEPISTNDTEDLPPSIVMQTAWVTDHNVSLTLEFGANETNRYRTSLLLLYFAEIENINMSATRSFNILINNQSELYEPITIVRNYSASEVQLRLNVTDYSVTFVNAPNSSYGPILNALEYYKIIDTDPLTSIEDTNALDAIKTSLNIRSWISDPCYVIGWHGIGCDKISTVIRITEMFIENNNFSGVIPAQLLDKPSLKFKHSGNHYLCIRMYKGKCILSNSKKTKASVVLGSAISGAVIMALVLIVVIIIALRRKKLRKIKRRIKDKSMITIPNPTMSASFSLKEMVKATQNFGQKIGQGGFGSVFFGKLAGGRDIAVKVLSLSSKQGIHEFKNEIDLLSRVHHKNLVALLGYCNQSKELMLIYEHMSRGSLRDHLYGSKAGNLELNWKTRLQIALDAAQGLEYLHVGCTPKIIHRDVKTANILLNCNLNGKLADFGLSRTTSDGEATHVTTTVKGTAGYLDPDYFRTQTLTEKSDVYSFGVVLLEIICGRPPINANLPEEELNIIQWVTSSVENESAGGIEEIIDRRLGGNYNMKSITGIAKLALRCVEAKRSSRPSVSEVVAEIKEAIMHENENNAPLPNSEVIGIECRDLQAGPFCSRVDDMQCGENSSNLPQVGR